MESCVLPYKNRDDAFIIIKLIREPYGPESASVISIGSTLKGDIENPTWKVHIPINLLSETRAVIESFENGL